MGDYSWQQLIFGGAVTEADWLTQLVPLISEIMSSYELWIPDVNHDPKTITAPAAKALQSDAVIGNRCVKIPIRELHRLVGMPFDIEDCEARGDQFEMLTATLRHLGLPYIHEDGGYSGAWTACYESWIPDDPRRDDPVQQHFYSHEGVRCTLLTTGEFRQEVITADALNKVLEEAAKHYTLEALPFMVKEACFPPAIELPPLTIKKVSDG